MADENIVRTTAGPGSDNQQLFQISSSGALNTATAGTLAVHTTSPGKIFYITDILITTEIAAGVANLIQLEISGGVVVFEGYVANTAPLDLPGIESQPQSPSNSILALKWGNIAGHITYFIAGYEQ